MAKRKAKRKIGRPSSRTPEVVEEICRRLAEGELLINICNGDERLPALQTVYGWAWDNDEFRQLYTRARQQQASTLMEKGIKEGLEATDRNSAYVARVRADIFARFAARMHPEQWGDRMHYQHSGQLLIKAYGGLDPQAVIGAEPALQQLPAPEGSGSAESPDTEADDV